MSQTQKRRSAVREAPLAQAARIGVCGPVLLTMQGARQLGSVDEATLEFHRLPSNDARAPRTATDDKTFAQSLRERPSGLARSVTYIYESASASANRAQSATFLGLVRELTEPYAREMGVSIAVEGVDRAVSEPAMTSLALIFNELAPNALKYGSLGRANGSLIVSTGLAGSTFQVRWI